MLAVTFTLALAALTTANPLSNLMVARHTPEDCSSSAMASTRKCTVKAGECCPTDWSCVVPAGGKEVCLANAKSSACPPNFEKGNAGICVQSPTGSAVAPGSGSTGSGSVTVPAPTPITTVTTLTTSTISTSLSTSGSTTFAVPVTIVGTTTSAITVLPTTTPPTVSGGGVSTSFSVSGSVTVAVPISLSTSGSVTIPVAVTTGTDGSLSVSPTGSTTDSADGSGATAPPNGGSNIGPSVLAAFVGGVIALVFA